MLIVSQSGGDLMSMVEKAKKVEIVNYIIYFSDMALTLLQCLDLHV